MTDATALPVRREGRDNYRRVLEYVQAHPGARQNEVAEALGLSPMAVNRHFQTMRRQWSTTDAKRRD